MNKQICPECQSETDEQSLVCDCGYLFVDALDVRGHSELQTIKWRKTKGQLKKIALIGGIAILCMASILYWLGWAGSAEKSMAEVPPNIGRSATSTAQNLISPSGSANPTTDAKYIVTSVSTGDTITVSSGTNELKRVRIYGIVSPKLDEHFGNESRAYLSRQILGKSISLAPKKGADDGQLLAEVFMNGINIGIEQIRAGLARLAIDQSSQPDPNFFRSYLEAEFVAKSGRFGIWAGGIGELPTVPGGEIDGVASNPQVPYRSSRGSSKFRLTGISSPFDPSYESVEMVRQELPVSNESTVPTRPDEAPSNAIPKDVPTVQISAKNEDTIEPVKPHSVVSSEPAGRTYTRGSRGGCYYLSASGNRVYVDRSLCN